MRSAQSSWRHQRSEMQRHQRSEAFRTLIHARQSPRGPCECHDSRLAVFFYLFRCVAVQATRLDSSSVLEDRVLEPSALEPHLRTIS